MKYCSYSYIITYEFISVQLFNVNVFLRYVEQLWRAFSLLMCGCGIEWKSFQNARNPIFFNQDTRNFLWQAIENDIGHTII